MTNTTPAKPPTSYAVLLYPGFQALDAFGPLDALNILAGHDAITLSILAPTMDPVSTNPLPRTNVNWAQKVHFAQSVVPTHTFDNPPEKIDVLLIPGGWGTHDVQMMEAASKLVRDLYPTLQYVFTVCTGSKIPAAAGILDGRNATTNKVSFEKVAAQYPKVNWVQQARWVVDGNIWTTSGVSAGIDGMLALIEHNYGKEMAEEIATTMEYIRQEDASVDPFCKKLLAK